MSLPSSLQLEQAVIDFVCDSEHKVSPWELERKLPGGYGKKQIRVVVKNLVARAELAYTQFYGRTFLEKSFNRPVRVSERVVLKPPSISYDPMEGDVVVALCHGESFGTGSHPTTRLSIQGIEQLFLSQDAHVAGGASVDIGTGSGVLAVAAVLLGMDRCLGVDIDPCAVHEAKENVALNGLSSHIQIFPELDLEAVKDQALVIANLRFPTLVSLADVVRGMLGSCGYAVFSGIKREELNNLKKRYGDLGFTTVWEACEKQWAGVVFRKH